MLKEFDLAEELTFINQKKIKTRDLVKRVLEDDEQALDKADLALALETVIDDICLVEQNLDLNNLKQVRDLIWQRLKFAKGTMSKSSFSDILRLYLFSKNSAVVLQTENNTSSSSDYLRFIDKTYQQCSIAVLNSTEVNGLANNISTILEKNGFLVIREGSYSEKLSRTTIYHGQINKPCELVLKKVLSFFSKESKLEENTSLVQEFRADLLIILAKDLTTKQN
ncbi:MAG: LytR C-terminal domain-containing protein [Candidatus Woesebacteria bacterium]